jgi:hypothetical protein
MPAYYKPRDEGVAWHIFMARLHHWHVYPPQDRRDRVELEASPLHVAAQNGLTEVVDLLLSQIVKPDLNAVDIKVSAGSCACVCVSRIVTNSGFIFSFRGSVTQIEALFARR